MNRKKIIAGNWKMNLLPLEAETLIDTLQANLQPQLNISYAIMPQAPLIETCMHYLQGGGTISIGAQDCSAHISGAYTGEISPQLLKSLGCRYTIVGHSERREYHNESNELVSQKANLLLGLDIQPIICIGETDQERKDNLHFEKVKTQVQSIWQNAALTHQSKIVLAYEPIWAIGTGNVATAEQANEMHTFIRKTIAEVSSPTLANTISILYGGSAKPDNVASLAKQPDIDGFLVGGASLSAESFLTICNAFPS